MPVIILTRGIQGSGKTTWAKKWVSENPENRVRWNNDDMRKMCGPYWIPKREPFISQLFYNFLDTAMASSKDIVIDNMNLNASTVQNIKAFVDNKKDFNYKIVFKDFFDVSLEECIARDAKRENPIGEKVIKDTFHKYRSVITKGYYANKPAYLEDESLPHCIIVDMDGTLCQNVTGRPWYGPGSAQGMEKDKVVPGVVKILQNYKDTIIICTGRDEDSLDATWDFLQKNNIPFSTILCRETGDMRKGNEVKRDLYNEYIKGIYYVDFVIDDSSKVVKMWRDLGILCLQPDYGYQ